MNPQWIKGKPTESGRWLVRILTRDEVVAVVTREEDDDGNKYLRIIMDGDSDPLNDPHSQARFITYSFGPIPNPSEKITS